jgi:hypothetical protein
MADSGKRSRAQQARRDARKRKARRQSERATQDEAPLIDEIREALTGHPLDLLFMGSMVIEATAPTDTAFLTPPDEEAPPRLDELLAAFIGTRVLETTALLAVLDELVDDDLLRTRCRREIDARRDSLPRWLAELADTTVVRTVRMTDVFGDADELLVGLRLADGQQITCAIHVDHLMMSAVRDAFFVPESIDTVLGVATASNTDPDTSFHDMDPAECRARLQYSLQRPPSLLPVQESDTWPSSRSLVRWLVRLMPDGGWNFPVPERVWDTGLLLDRFFASPLGMSMDDRDHRELLELCIDDGTGDPLRWSEARLRDLLSTVVAFDDEIPVTTQLDLPKLLRAFVPFAHAESGIRPELTTEALAAIDDAADQYRAEVLVEADDRENPH